MRSELLYRYLPLALLSMLLCQCKQASVQVEPIYEIQRSAYYDTAAISGPHPLATEAAQEILETGGNAIDAAVAMQLAMAVCYPRAGNLGGGGFMIYRPADGEVRALDFREQAPLAAHRDMYLDSTGAVVPGRSRLGHLAVGVPGTVAGMQAMYKEYGSMPWRDLFAPALRLARAGYRLSQAEAGRLNHYQDDIAAFNDAGAFVGETFIAGQTLVQAELEQTLLRLRDTGGDDFYTGETAQLIVDEMVSAGGVITLDDLSSYRPLWREPITVDYRGHRIFSMPPSSSGGIALAQMLTMLEVYDLTAYPTGSVAQVHLLAELMRRAYADRAEYLGDADHYPVPVTDLLDPDYLQSRMADFDTKEASSSDTLVAGSAVGLESYETTHISIVDKMGNAVSLTTTLNGNYGSKVVVDGAGFFLNNEMDDFSAKPGVPNLYGLVGAEANAIAPRKRMLSSMTPTIVERGDDLLLVLGAPGGSTIITAVLQTMINVIDYGMPIDSAIVAARVHHQWLPDEIVYEQGGLTTEVVAQLEAMGHTTRAVDRMAVVKAVMVLADGRLHAAADKRNPDDDVAGN